MRLNGSPVARARTKIASERSSSVASDWTSRTARKRRIARSGSEPGEQRAPDALRQEQDEGHEDRPDHERPGLGEDREAVLEDEERRGTDEGTEEGAGAAEERHDDDLPRGRPVERLDRDEAEPVVAAGLVGQVEPDEVEELGERERQHREVDAAPAQAEEADRRAARRREAEPCREREPQRADLELRERDARAVGAEPPVGGVAEREQPRVAVKEVEAEGEEAVDQDLCGERLVRHQEREDGEDDEEPDDGMGGDPSPERRHAPRLIPSSRLRRRARSAGRGGRAPSRRTP